MANNENLKDYHALTPTQQRDFHSKGGKASVRAKRARKTAYEIAKMFFEEKIDVAGKKLDRKQLMLINAMKRINDSIMSNSKAALTSDELKSMDYFLQMIGEAPIPKTQQEVTVSAPLQIIDDVQDDDDYSDNDAEGTD